MKFTIAILLPLLFFTPSCVTRGHQTQALSQNEWPLESIYQHINSHYLKGGELPADFPKLTHQPTFGFEAEGHSARVLNSYGMNGDKLEHFASKLVAPEMARIYLTWCMEEIRKLGPVLQPTQPDSELPPWDLSDSDIYLSPKKKNISQLRAIFRVDLNPPDGILFDYLPPDLQLYIYNRYPIKMHLIQRRGAIRQKIRDVDNWSEAETLKHILPFEENLVEKFQKRDDGGKRYQNFLKDMRYREKKKLIERYNRAIPKHLLVLNEKGRKLGLAPVLKSEAGGMWEVNSKPFSTFTAHEEGLEGFIESLAAQKGENAPSAKPSSVHATVVVGMQDLNPKKDRKGFHQYLRYLQAYAVLKSAALAHHPPKSLLRPLDRTKIEELAAHSLEFGGHNAIRVQKNRIHKLKHDHLRLELRLNADSVSYRRAAFLSFLTNLHGRTWREFNWSENFLLDSSYKRIRSLPLPKKQAARLLTHLSAYKIPTEAYHKADTILFHIPAWNWKAIYSLSPTEAQDLNEATEQYFTRLSQIGTPTLDNIIEATAAWTRLSGLIPIAHRHLYPMGSKPFWSSHGGSN